MPMGTIPLLLLPKVTLPAVIIIIITITILALLAVLGPVTRLKATTPITTTTQIPTLRAAITAI